MHQTLLAAAWLLTAAFHAAQAAEPRPAQSGPNEPSRPAGGEVVSELSKHIFVVFQDAKGTYWFGTEGDGVYRLDGKRLVRFTTRDGLSNPRIREIQEDHEGNLLVATLTGIDRFDGERFTTLSAVDSPFPDGGWRLDPNDLWFAGLYGKPGHNGPFRYDGKTLHRLTLPRHPRDNEPLARNPNAASSPYEVYDIYRDRRGHVWIGTLVFGACRYDGRSWAWIHEDHMTTTDQGGQFGTRSILEDRDGAFWFCNTRHRYRVKPNPPENGLIAYDREDGVKIQAPDGRDTLYFMSAVEDDAGALWLATYRDGIYRIQGDSTTRFPVKDGDLEAFVYSMSRDNYGTLWLGTRDAGAFRFNGTAFVPFTP